LSWLFEVLTLALPGLEAAIHQSELEYYRHRFCVPGAYGYRQEREEQTERTIVTDEEDKNP
jgi:hypothetical protein